MEVNDAALVSRARTDALTWINAVHMQYHRINMPLVDPDCPGNEIWRQEIDLHFLLVSMTRLRRAIELAATVKSVEPALRVLLHAFDAEVPVLHAMRNVGEHFDDYTVGRGRLKDVRRHQLQTWMINGEPGRIEWVWFGRTLDVNTAYKAAKCLHREFCSATDQIWETDEQNPPEQFD